MLSTSESQHQMNCRLFLNIVVSESAVVVQLFSSEDKSLLIGWDTFSVLYFSFDVLYSV